jgi:H/ACA ribonucleoprotein complex subunit 2
MLNPYSICIIAADISPIDVLSHLPILCEEKNVAYIYVKSRAEIGDSCKTKRPTSCVFIQAPAKKEETFKKFLAVEDLVRERNPYI